MVDQPGGGLVAMELSVNVMEELGGISIYLLLDPERRSKQFRQHHRAVEADNAGLVDLVWRYLVQGWKGKDIPGGVDHVVWFVRSFGGAGGGEVEEGG